MEFIGAEEVREIGLRLPDGSEVWPPDTLQKFPLSTPQERRHLVDQLAKTAQDLNYPVEEFLDKYRWVTRRLLRVILSEPVGEFSVITPSLIGAFDDWPREDAVEPASGQEQVEAGDSGV